MLLKYFILLTSSSNNGVLLASAIFLDLTGALGDAFEGIETTVAEVAEEDIDAGVDEAEAGLKTPTSDD